MNALQHTAIGHIIAIIYPLYQILFFFTCKIVVIPVMSVPGDRARKNRYYNDIGMLNSEYDRCH